MEPRKARGLALLLIFVSACSPRPTSPPVAGTHGKIGLWMGKPKTDGYFITFPVTLRNYTDHALLIDTHPENLIISAARPRISPLVNEAVDWAVPSGLEWETVEPGEELSLTTTYNPRHGVNEIVELRATLLAPNPVKVIADPDIDGAAKEKIRHALRTGKALPLTHALSSENTIEYDFAGGAP